MKLLQMAKCLIGRHKRDSRRVVHDGESFTSVCIGCGAQMLREFHGWRVDRAGK